MKLPQEIPLAIQHFHSLQDLSASLQLQAYLNLLAEPKAHSIEYFIVGMREFMRVANLGAEEREAFFGSPFCGVHYQNELADRWNAESRSTIQADQLSLIHPHGWDYAHTNSLLTLVYRGNSPSEALNNLIKGPTVIDCGMFCQLSLWFGMRYMLGNEVFDELFSRGPFYLTQYLYEYISNPSEPYYGNPLYLFFSETLASEEEGPHIHIEHVRNHPDYQLKHPGGASAGQNCVLVDDVYHMFEPGYGRSAGLSKSEVEAYLVHAFNQGRTAHDENKLSRYLALGTPSLMHSGLQRSYAELIEAAGRLSDVTIDESILHSNTCFQPLPKLRFDFKLFIRWVNQMTNKTSFSVNYRPLTSSTLNVPAEFMNQIPFENRRVMCFDTFQVDSLLQAEIKATALAFCHDVMRERSCRVVLTGRAGIGKTAAAVSCAKELISQGKRVVWLSESMMNSWSEQAGSSAELHECRVRVQALLTPEVDAVFLDDDNLVGWAGQVLLEEINRWYVIYQKGLFITSNEGITLKNCYGWQLNQTYDFPPFLNYMSRAYMNTNIRSGLEGPSLRVASARGMLELSDDEKVRMLKRCSPEQSVGIIIDKATYEGAELQDVEFIPGIDGRQIDDMTSSLASTNTLGPAYDALTPDQKFWTYRFRLNKFKMSNGIVMITNEFHYQSIGVRRFEKTDRQIIAIELLSRQANYWEKSGININEDTVRQLLRVIHYAHDTGGKKVIIINSTEFSTQELLQEIKEAIPSHERERSMARLELLLFTPALLSEANPSMPPTEVRVSSAECALFSAGDRVCEVPVDDDLSP